jgi:hypothetical protein
MRQRVMHQQLLDRHFMLELQDCHIILGQDLLI